MCGCALEKFLGEEFQGFGLGGADVHGVNPFLEPGFLPDLQAFADAIGGP